jgi:putative FmdB family regulatory protein
MPFYSYHCNDCGEEFEKLLKFSEYDSHQQCPHCESNETEKNIVMCSVVFKGDSWCDKNLRIKKQMRAKNKKLDKKQKERWEGKVKLAPNVDGERVESWSDAQKLAKSQGKSTATYDKLVREEKSKK